MKKKLRSLLLSILLCLTFLPFSVNAIDMDNLLKGNNQLLGNSRGASTHDLSLDVYNCNALDEEEFTTCVNDSGEPIEMVPLADDAGIYPGKLIRVDVHYSPSATAPDYMMQFSIEYDEDLVAPFKDGNDIYMLDLLTTYSDGIFPPKGSTGNKRFQTNYEVLTNDVNGKHKVKVLVQDTATGGSVKLTEEGTLFTMFFEVKDDAEPGSPVNFVFRPEDAVMSNGSQMTLTNKSLKIYAELDTDTTLSSITVKNGSTNYPLSPEFDSDTKQYTVYVPNNISSVDVDAETTKPSSAVTGTGSQSLSVSTMKTADLLVTAQSGDTDTYSVGIYRLNNNADLSALGLTDVDFGTFSSNTTSYTATVPFTTTSTTVSATAADSTNATVSGTGAKNLSIGENTISVEVTPENCKSQYSSVPGNTCVTKTYTVTVTRVPASEDAKLDDLTVDGTTVPGFDPETTEYTLDDVANNKASVTIGATTSEEHATIEGTGAQNLSVGNNALKVTVTAQDGTTVKEYTINIKRKSNDNTLSSLTVTSDPAGTLSPAFDPTKTSYTYNVDANEDEVTIEAVASNAGATVEGTGTYNPRTTNSVTITVTPEDGTAKEYTITFDVAKSDNADLSSLGVTGYTIDPVFDKDTITYNVTVPSDVDKATITAELADDRASKTGDGEQDLGYGENSFPVVVTAEDGTTTKTYTVNITREKKTDAKLSDLKVDGTSVPGFDPETYTYNLPDVANDKTKVNITYTKSDSDAEVTGDGEQNLSVGDNALEVVVTAQDGTTKKTYTINIRRKNDNRSLSSLTVTSDPQGTLSPAFDPETTEYTFSVEPDVTSVTVSADPADDNATVAGEGTYNPRTDGPVELVVTSENGNTKTYTITFDVAKSDNADLSSLGVTGYTIDPVFDKDTITYNVTVPSDVDKATITAELADDRASKTGDGEQDLGYGENSFPVVVTAEDGTTTKTYTVNITREKKTDAKLSDLKVDGTSVPGFDPETYTYNLPDVANDKTKVNITYTKSDSDAEVTGDGEQNLSVGDNALEVVVTAQDGTTKKTYTINIRRKNDNRSLSSLTVTSDPQGTLSPAFDPETTEYTFSVDADEDEVTINAEPADDKATVTGTGTYNPRTDGPVEIIVTSENGNTKVYTVTFDVAKSDNADLSSLGVTGYTIDPVFDKDTITYNVTVPSDVDKATITAELADDRASKTGDGEQDLGYGENSFPVVVTAEDGTTTKTYTVNITREKKTDAKLSDLKVDGTSVPGFDPETYTYNLPDVANDKTKVNITYTKSDSDAEVTGDGEQNLSVGDNALEVVVTAQDGTTKKTYTINIRRKNDNRSLSSLTVTSDPQGTLSPAFDPETTEYTYVADPDETEITVSATVPDGSNATISGEGTYDPRTTDKVEVVVTAEDGTEKTYTINLELAKSTNADLSSLGVTGYTISPAFDKDTLDYTLTVPANVDKATITAELADDRATLTGTGEKDINYGSNPFEVKVTAEDGTTEKTYKVTITREKKTDATLSDIKVNGVSIPGFDPDTTEYTIDPVNSDVDSILIEATLNDSDATLTGTGTKTVQTGDNSFDIVVTAQDGTTTKTYTVNVKKNSSDSSLSGITITSEPQGTFEPAFDPAVTEYTYVADPDEDEVVISATPNQDGASVSGEGTYNPHDTDTVELIVTAEDGTTTTYVIHLENAKSTNANLSDLGVTGETLSPAFDKDTTSYTVTVDSDTDKVTITATAEDNRSTVTGTGEKDLTYGSNPFEVKVTAEDGTTTKTYTVVIERELSSDVKLSDLKVDGTTVDGFDPDVPTYTLPDVGNDVDSIQITATPENDEATVEVVGADANGNVPLEVGENTIEVKVTAQDGSVGTYTVTVTREADDNNDLKSLEVEGYDLTPDFDKDETNYTLTVPSDVDSITVNAEPDADTATVTGTGSHDLQPGENTIEVKVTAEDGTEKTYTITVTKEDDDEKITSIEYGHIIEDHMIKTVEYKSVPETLRDQLDNENWKLHIFDKDDTAEIDEEAKLGTGMIIKLIINDSVKDDDYLVVKGDVDGNSRIALLDAVMVLNHYLENNTLEGVWFEAADMDSNGQVKLLDAVNILKVYLDE